MQYNPAKDININVAVRYIAEQSDPAKQRFVFSYRVTITNQGIEAVRLERRRWVITDGEERVQEVEGEGVVGEQPLIEPSSSYEYSSGAVLATKVGSMQGHYEMALPSGERFYAPISPFTLAQPNALH